MADHSSSTPPGASVSLRDRGKRADREQPDLHPTLIMLRHALQIDRAAARCGSGDPRYRDLLQRAEQLMTQATDRLSAHAAGAPGSADPHAPQHLAEIVHQALASETAAEFGQAAQRWADLAPGLQVSDADSAHATRVAEIEAVLSALAATRWPALALDFGAPDEPPGPRCAL